MSSQNQQHSGQISGQHSGQHSSQHQHSNMHSNLASNLINLQGTNGHSANSVAHSVSSMSIVSRSSLPGNISRDTLSEQNPPDSPHVYGIRKNEVNTLGRYGSIRKNQNK